MVYSSQRAFVLPYALLLGSVLLVLGTLFVLQGQHQIKRMEEALLRTEAENTLRLNIQPLVRGLEEQLENRDSASALMPGIRGLPGTFRSIMVVENSKREWPLSSVNADEDEPVLFLSTASEAVMEADLLPFSPDGGAIQTVLAWAVQDLSLLPSDQPPPPFWPLPGWDWAIHEPQNTVSQFLDEETHGQWRDGPWIPGAEPLPFLMDSSPAFVPVVEELRLRMGIFASGPVRSREKVLRIRFYLEGRLWNPYNRPLQIHQGSGMRSVFQLLFYNLPEVRIINLDRGVSTNWIPMDEIENAYSGKSGFHGWIRLPGSLESGERYQFSEPDVKWQPEGLARTLHPAFMVGPADHIKIEFRDQPGGIHVACLPLESNDLMEAAYDGDGWFRVEGFPVEFEQMELDRADEGDRPFYLASGSLSFRRENAQLALGMAWNPEALTGLIDPRRRILNHEDGEPSPEGGWTWDKDLLTINVDQLTSLDSEDSAQPDPASRIPLFSWPESEPETLLEASDLPQWSSGFRIGSPGSNKLNELLNKAWAWPLTDSSEAVFTLPGKDGEDYLFRKLIPVNLLSYERWATLLTNTPFDGFSMKYHAYPWAESIRSTDYRTMSIMELDLGIKSLMKEISLNPSTSVGQFFDRGLLVDNFSSPVSDDPLQKLMPLRGWLRNSPILKPHGSSWLLHMVVRVQNGSSEYWRSARIWLLETSLPGEPVHLDVIQFEWTDPEEHLEFSGQ